MITMETDADTSEYFNAYEDLEVHYLMLQDEQRNQAYKAAIFENKELIKDKVILDVGAGTGILSIFCAQMGAAKVYAVEASGLYKIAEEVVKENKFEHIIEVIHSKVEDLTLPTDSIDVIVSEWMGFYLLHEGMLESVIIARDKFLKTAGHMFPEEATIYAAPCSLPSMYDFWNNINGVAMSSVAQKYRELKAQKPEILQIAEKDLRNRGEAISYFDLRDVKLEELQSVSYKDVVIAENAGKYQGLCLWFECLFPSNSNDKRCVLSTAPWEPATHWKQTVIVLPTEFEVERASPIAYELKIQKREGRQYNIEFTMIEPEDVEHPGGCACHMTKCIIIKKMLEQYEAADNKNCNSYLYCFLIKLSF